MNLVLIGYRGTGKSSVATLLGQQLGWPVVSLDDEIERQAGQRIVDIVAQRGWDGFRDLEQALCHSYAQRQGQILDCGGGVVERQANIEALRRSGTVIWLVASRDVIVRRIAGDDRRPSLTGTHSFTDEVAEVLERRMPLYGSTSHFQVDTDHRTVLEIAQEILKLAGPRLN